MLCPEIIQKISCSEEKDKEQPNLLILFIINFKFNYYFIIKLKSLLILI